jgi:GxxExxY protein
MHRLYEQADRLSKEVLGAAIEVHRMMGCGLLESIYEKCLHHELSLRGMTAITQQQVQVRYKDFAFEEQLKYDLLVDGCLLIEVKAVQQVLPVHKAQLMSYMKLLDTPLGLILNFHDIRLADGISRMLLPGANLTEDI